MLPGRMWREHLGLRDEQIRGLFHVLFFSGMIYILWLFLMIYSRTSAALKMMQELQS